MFVAPSVALLSSGLMLVLLVGRLGYRLADDLANWLAGRSPIAPLTPADADSPTYVWTLAHLSPFARMFGAVAGIIIGGGLASMLLSLMG